MGDPTDADALNVLRTWGFGKNSNRLNVLPEDTDWVYSDTLGLVFARGKSSPQVSGATHEHETVFRLLHRWTQAKAGYDCPCTSMSLNSAYSAKMHRDGSNAGPSVG